jgi:hypothetical protein
VGGSSERAAIATTDRVTVVLAASSQGLSSVAEDLGIREHHG